jgi:hypothetical protein
MRVSPSLSLLCPAALLLAACSSSPSSPDASLTVLGSAAAPAGMTSAHRSLQGRSLSFAAAVTTGDPASVLIGMYALWISPNADCSNAVLVQDYGSSPAVKDFVAGPVLFTGEPAAGTYECIVIKMSDAIDFSSASAFGACSTGVVYHQDIYREGESDWKDVNLTTIVGSGTDDAPGDDHVAIVITTDTTAAITRGFSTNQVVPLASPLVVPGSSTFYWNAEGSVTTEDGRPCGLMPGAPAFE